MSVTAMMLEVFFNLFIFIKNSLFLTLQSVRICNAWKLKPLASKCTDSFLDICHQKYTIEFELLLLTTPLTHLQLLIKKSTSLYSRL